MMELCVPSRDSGSDLPLPALEQSSYKQSSDGGISGCRLSLDNGIEFLLLKTTMSSNNNARKLGEFSTSLH